MVTGKDIKAKRKELGLSVVKLAHKLKLPADNIYKWEKGTRPSDPEDYKKIEKFVLEGLYKIEDIPNFVNEELEYGNKNFSDLLKIIRSQQEMISKQQETIHMLVSAQVRKKAS